MNNEALSLRIEVLELSTRTCNLLIDLGIRTVRDLLDQIPNNLLLARSCGPKTLGEIQDLVYENRVAWGIPEDHPMIAKYTSLPSIDELFLSLRTDIALKFKAGISHFSELLKRTPADLLRKGFGRKSLLEVQGLLYENRVAWGVPEDHPMIVNYLHDKEKLSASKRRKSGMKIEHVKGYGPQFQWLRAIDDSGKARFGSVGVALPGVYDFPPSKNGETITMLSGSMTINGHLCTSPDRSVFVKAGEGVHIEVHEPSRYMADHFD